MAEGIETVDQMNFLRQNDCTKGQGYLFAQPEQGLDLVQRFEAPPVAPFQSLLWPENDRN